MRTTTTQTKHAALAYGAWGILSCAAGAGLAFFFFFTLGIAGVIPAISPVFAAFTTWFPTQGSARGRSDTYRVWCLVLVLVSGTITAFTAGVAGQMLFDRITSAQLTENNNKRADKVTTTATEARKGGLSSRSSSEVARTAAELLKTDAVREEKAMSNTEPDPEWLQAFKAKWMRLIEWANGLFVFAAQSLLFVLFREKEDLDRNGIPDYLEEIEDVEIAPKV